MLRRHLLFVLACLVLPPAGARRKPPDPAPGKPPERAPERIPDNLEVARMIIANTNEFRKSEHRSAVAENPKLASAARDFARFLSTNDSFSHTADGRRPEERAVQQGYDYCVVAENLAYRYNSEGFEAGRLAREFVEGWENSPGHRKNMLRPDVREIGVAIVRNDRSGYYYAVQMFGRPASDTIAFKVSNRSDTLFRYWLDGEGLSLPPGATRTHQQCGAGKLDFRLPGDRPVVVHTAADGDHYVLTQSSGTYRLKKE